jgi:Flp pilus assembly pilin Flp
MLYNPRSEQGQGLMEYALILILVSVISVAILVLFGPTLGNLFSEVVNNLNR